MRVYLDNCCYNRPFDEQAQLRVRLETEAKMEVQSQMRLGSLEYVWSEMLTNRGAHDYTRWRENNMYIGESVRETAARAKAAAARLEQAAAGKR